MTTATQAVKGLAAGAEAFAHLSEFCAGIRSDHAARLLMDRAEFAYAAAAYIDKVSHDPSLALRGLR